MLQYCNVNENDMDHHIFCEIFRFLILSLGLGVISTVTMPVLTQKLVPDAGSIGHNCHQLDVAIRQLCKVKEELQINRRAN